MELPYINGKTIKTTITLGVAGKVDEIHLTFLDGQTLVIRGTDINLSLLPAAFEPPATTAIVSAQTKWPGEKAND